MSKERFDHLVNLVKRIQKDTVSRKAIPAEEMLVMTLRYLAARCSQQTLSSHSVLGVLPCARLS